MSLEASILARYICIVRSLHRVVFVCNRGASHANSPLATLYLVVRSDDSQSSIEVAGGRNVLMGRRNVARGAEKMAESVHERERTTWMRLFFIGLEEIRERRRQLALKFHDCR